MSLEREEDEIMVQASAGGRPLGSVLFVDYDGELMPQDLEVDERYRGQGIAAAMYDYVKSQGYKIRRSGQQTDAGAGFWAKHRPDSNVWEQGVAEARTKSCGDCFEVAGRAMITPEVPEMRLVHAYVTGQGPIAGKRFSHAWNEIGDVVLDYSNGRQVVMRKPQYYELVQISTEPGEYAAYNDTQAKKRMVQTRHWGPWDLDPSKEKIDEVKILSKVKGKGSEPGQLPRYGRPIGPGEETRYLGTKVADWQGREIWRDYLGGQLSYHLFDPDTRTVIVTTFGSRYKMNPRSYIIHGLYAAPGNPVRAAEFYRGLVRDLGLTLISDRKQSPGGNRVWQQLEQFPDVEVYGYDTNTDQALNFGAKDVEMYTVPSAAVAGSREMQRVARDLRLVATARSQR